MFKLLRDYGVIHASSRWSNRAIAKFFNELAKNPMVQPDDSLAEVRMALKDYYESSKNSVELTRRKVNKKIGNWGSYFKQTYCRNPWTVMGLVAGIIILALTAIQTYYAVLQYYDNNRSPPLHR